MSRTLWINPVVGVAGDMMLAALVDLGADTAFVRSQLERLPVGGWDLSFETCTRAGLTCTSARVATAAETEHRPWSQIDSLLADSGLDERIRDGARSTFRRLASAEATVHGIAVDDVRFHEVGAVDAIVDIVGAWAALTALEIGHVRSAPVGLGTGTAATAHGTIPVPAPATLELLRGVAVLGVPHRGETATPTGVALLVTMCDEWGDIPDGTVESLGRGAGTLDPPSHANVVSVALLETTPAERPIAERVLIETNVDDVAPEILGHVIDRALDLGADDAWVVPITMKKSRPAHEVRLLCRVDLADSLVRMLAAETGTLGVRRSTIDKVEFDRRIDVVDLDGWMIHVKVGPHGAKPEHDDVAAASLALDLPLRQVAARALGLWRQAASSDREPI